MIGHYTGLYKSVGGRYRSFMDDINHPSHYVDGRAFEPIDVFNEYFRREPLLWQVGKYLSRLGRKGDALKDLRKAEFYLKRKLDDLVQSRFDFHYGNNTNIANPDAEISLIVGDWFRGEYFSASRALAHLMYAATSTEYSVAHLHLKTSHYYLNEEIEEQESAMSDKTNYSFADYESEAISTAIYSPGHAVMYPALGMCGEAGEVAEKVKKLFRDHDGMLTDEYRESIKKEIGDVLWYIAALSRDLGIRMEDAARVNIEKLRSRKERGVIKGNGDER